MCGIFGYSFKDRSIGTGKLALLGSTLAHCNDERGGDSWGLVTLDYGIEIVRGLKEMGPNSFRLADYQTLFGHTRWATHGAKTLGNAHPFEINNIIGAHNGIVYNADKLNQKYNRKYEVDSPHLFAHLAENRSFSDIEGYGSIQWIDKNVSETTIKLCRMHHGDLAVYGVGDADGKTYGIVWTSDDLHLDRAMEMAGIENFWPYIVEQDAVLEVADGELSVTTETLTLKESRSTIKWSDFKPDAEDRSELYRSLWPDDIKPSKRSVRCLDEVDPDEMSQDELERYFDLRYGG